MDNSERYPDSTEANAEAERGFIDKNQMDWLKKTLQTRRNVVVAMHIPMLRRDNLDEIRTDYLELEKMLVASGNVKHIFSGHFHVTSWDKEINGIQYHIIPSLSLENNEGQFKKITLTSEE